MIRILVSFCYLSIGYIYCQKSPVEKKEISHHFSYMDNYLHLEETENTGVLSWIEEQNKISSQYLASIAPSIDKIYNEKISLKTNKTNLKKRHITRDSITFYIKNGSSGNSVCFKKPNDSICENLIDSSNLPKPFRSYYFTYIQPSWNGKMVVLAATSKGKESATIFIYDIINKKLFPTKISGIKTAIGGIHWLPDNSGIVYNKSNALKANSSQNNIDTKVFLYTLENDREHEFFSRENNPSLPIEPENFPIVKIKHPKDNYLIGEVANSSPNFDAYYTKTELSTFDILDAKKWRPLFKKEDEIKNYYQKGDMLYYLTSKNTPNFEIRKVRLSDPDFSNAQIVVKEKKDEIIKGFELTDKGLFYNTVRNGVQSKLYRVHQNKDHEIHLPIEAGSIFLESMGWDRSFLLIEALGWLSPSTKFTYDFNKDKVTNKVFGINYNRSVPAFLNNFKISELVVPAFDGELIPLSLIYPKDLKLDGNNPVFMRAYGAYGSSLIPFYYYDLLVPAIKGGIYAIAHVRGGGEKGDNWYKGGFKETKHNSWKDLLACTEYLISNKYTSKKRIALWGSSAGGISVGRAITERPDLYGACILDFAFLNPVRAEYGLNGADISKEFGSIHKPEEAAFVYQMDPFHHLYPNIEYPATLIRTGLNDSRLSPWQSFKFYAKLKEMNSSNNPILLSVDGDSGHSSNESKDAREIRIISAVAFALQNTK